MVNNKDKMAKVTIDPAADMLEKTIDSIEKISKSENPVLAIIENIFNVFSSILNYEVFTTANHQHILISTIIFSIIVFLIGIKFARHFSKIIKERLVRKSIDVSKAYALEQISYYCFITIAALFALDAANIPITTFAFIGTAVALSIGMGCRDTINNFISGIILLVEQPIQLEAYVEINNVSGIVKNIGARCTRIETSDNYSILIPNGIFLGNIVKLQNSVKTQSKATINLQISMQKNIAEIERGIMNILNENPIILKNPEPCILYNSISNDIYDITIEFFFNPIKRKEVIISEFNIKFAKIIN